MPRKVIVVVLIIAFIYAIGNLLLGQNGMIAQYRIQKKNESLVYEIDSLHALLQARKVEAKQLKRDSSVMEAAIRTQFGYSRKGEKVFLFLDDQGSTRKDSTQPPNSPAEP